MTDDGLTPPGPPGRDGGGAGGAKRISRRRFLRRTLAGAALLGIGGTVLRNLGGYGLDESEAAGLAGLRVLSVKEALVLRALTRRLLASDEAGAPSPDELSVVRAADAYLAELPEHMSSDVRALLHLVEHTPFLFAFRASRYTRLDEAGQDAVIESWATSRLAVRRQGYAALKALAMMGYYGNPKTFGIPGYPGPLLPGSATDGRP